MYEAVIRRRARLDYADAATWLADRDEGGDEAPSWGSSLRCLDRIATDFLRAQAEAGALPLDLPEVEIVIDGET